MDKSRSNQIHLLPTQGRTGVCTKRVFAQRFLFVLPIGSYRREVLYLALFKEIFSDYIAKLHCTSKELSQICELSPVVISRYRSGERTPLKNSPQLDKLIHGLALLCAERGLDDTEQDIAAAFRSALPKNENDMDAEHFRLHLKKLSEASGIPMSHMARALSYDPSYLSKIGSGLRFPSSPEAFIDKLCRFVADTIPDPAYRRQILVRLDLEPSEENIREAFRRIQAAVGRLR